MIDPNFANSNKEIDIRRKMFNDYYKQSNRQPGEKFGVSVTWVGPPGPKSAAKPEHSNAPVQPPAQGPPPPPPPGPGHLPPPIGVRSEAERKALEKMDENSDKKAAVNDRPQSKYTQSYDVIDGRVWCSGIERAEGIKIENDNLYWSDITFEAYQKEKSLPEYKNQTPAPCMMTMGIKDVVNQQTKKVVLYACRQRSKDSLVEWTEPKEPKKLPFSLEKWDKSDRDLFGAIIGTPNVFGVAAMTLDNPNEYYVNGKRTQIKGIHIMLERVRKGISKYSEMTIDDVNIPEMWIYLENVKK